ncbi:MAG: RNA polymerase sigma-70 factor [Bacteroidetes bacterium HGW-Bacteroidetes-8]|jgi:RNA polymerase sigma-70 factor (ECF subfamily)|nr:MAG: RNA polymerase sigma-70 factor [Bacteroidetes bacterium HGW-Bacteroidetes-8]
MQDNTPNNFFSSNKTLLDALKDGKEEAYEYIFLKYYTNLYSYAFRILNNESDTKECIQSTFCHLWDIRKSLNINDSLKSYLYRSVYNGCIDIIRKKRVLEKYEEKGFLDIYMYGVVQNPEAEIKLQGSETRKAVQNSINSLPERCREIFIRCRVMGYSHAEIASSLNISVKTVENQMTIALTKLREKLKNFILF